MKTFYLFRYGGVSSKRNPCWGQDELLATVRAETTEEAFELFQTRHERVKRIQGV